MNSAHAHAADPFATRMDEFEMGCLNCHATGAPKENEIAEVRRARFLSVQCEQCHGPGGEHAANPGKGYGRINNMQALCSECHTSEMSPKFDLQTSWAKIKH